ncbi:hypothetical protein PGT21_030836 [Puccinia graminis f. sp. tritici]|uniref:Uncharacterized protein n=1 Tax=Puccinia graminis f. sp. tritici TaxID=56615 RepID=A0A5B0PMF1_PUCGR|nr:hypothetical protein PGT21_030836 [Puccinia graminis f. sp. tritici]
MLLIQQLQQDKANEESPSEDQSPQINWKDWLEVELERIWRDLDLDDPRDKFDKNEEDNIPGQEDQHEWTPFNSKMDFVRHDRCDT